MKRIRTGATFAFPAYYGHEHITSQSDPDFERRALPSFATQGTYFQVRLTTPIQEWDPTDPDRRTSSEVWHGLLLSVNSLSKVDQVDTPGAPTLKVVVKFFQPSLLPYPLTLGWNPDHLARMEAAGYDCFKSLQGSVIPYFFGKHTVLI